MMKTMKRKILDTPLILNIDQTSFDESKKLNSTLELDKGYKDSTIS